MTKNILIGHVTAPHGIKGQIKVASFTEDPEDFFAYADKVHDEQGNAYEIRRKGKSPGKNDNVFICKVEGLKDRNGADELTGTELFVDRKDMRLIDGGEFYHADLIGMNVVDDSSKETVGSVQNIYDFGGGGIVEVKFAEEHGGKITSFSFTNNIFPEVSLEENFITISRPEIIDGVER
jgi:16S rRNA processing protein RimM